ncbi:tripartite tricarboxylate transporter substrate binding protein [Mumia zhuanghuii]|uniref:Bug family tripartite tricarboxylate transporter substrate binding protein n=2 Tax=Mumia TaxID=1546255 RepID=A0ABW1QHX0_9ACTN|nr:MULTISPECIES: tripartite tricarboxylate transporter substrate binding protein [Mumia]KAA1418274.1 tripartite tricarboxylate transporter substrate binding protein [Mumia zhuanghuii]
MQRRTLTRTGAVAGAFLLTASLAACGGNLGGDEESSGEDFPDGAVTLTIGQDPGGSTDLIGRALADPAAKDLDESMPVVNKPGANGAVAAKELEGKAADGQNLMVINASLIAITPLAVSEDEVVDIEDYEVVTGISQDDYVLVANPASGWKTVDDLIKSGKKVNFGTTGVGTGSQLSSQLLFNQAGVAGEDVPFDGGAPAMTAVLGEQVDVASIQLGEAYPQIEAGKLTPLVVFSKERNQYLEDVPTAIESGYDVPVSQYRAIVAPKGTPEATIDRLEEAFQAAFDDPAYQEFNEGQLLTPHEISGDEVVKEWTEARDSYAALVEEYNIDMGDAS